MSASLLPTVVSLTQTLTGTHVVDTRKGDTLQKIAARVLKDASQWPTLANLNKLLPPYMTDDPACAGPNVLLSGTTITVPGPPPPASGVADQDDIYGTDLLLVNGQITDDGMGDFRTVSGLPNLEQALENRIGSHPGDLLFHLSYGCAAYRLLGQGATPADMQLAGAFVAKAVQSDPRVSSASDATAKVTGDAVSVGATAVTVSGKQLPVGTTSNLSG